MTDPTQHVRACQEAVRERGYGVLPGVVSPDECARALDLVREWEQRTAELELEGLPHLATDSPIIWNLHFKDRDFVDLVLGSEAVEQVLVHFLNDPWYKGLAADEPNYILRALVARSSVDALPLHIDSFVPYEGDTVISMQAAFSLEGMTEANGATLVVPGSHRSGRYFDPATDAADVVPVVADPGDVVFWDSRIWHGAGPNRAGRTRWTLTATFTRWWIKQAFRLSLIHI